MPKRGWLSGLFFIAGGAIGRDMVSWVVSGLADTIWAGRPRTVSWADFPWQNTIGAVCISIALVIAVWPSLIRLFKGRGAAIAQYDDSPLRDEVRDLCQAQSLALTALEQRLTTYEQDMSGGFAAVRAKFDELDPRFARLEAVAYEIAREERTKQIAFLRTEIDRQKAQTHVGNFDFQAGSAFPGTSRSLRSACQELDLFNAAEPEIGKETARIMGDAKYLIPDEQFEDGEQKRKWALRQMRLNAFANALEQVSKSRVKGW